MVHSSTKLRTFTYNDRTFGKVEELISFIESIPKEQRYDAQLDVLSMLLRAHGSIDDSIESFYIYIRNSGAYRQYVSETEFVET